MTESTTAHPSGSTVGPVRDDGSRLLCRLDELSATGCREFKFGEGDWPLRGFVVRVADGVRAYINRCAHLSYPLNYLPDEFLSYDREHILCTMHGALFEKETGLCVAGPCLARSLRSLPVRVVGDAVIVDAAAIEVYVNTSGDSNKSSPSSPPAMR